LLIIGININFMAEKNKAKSLLNRLLKGRPQPSAPRAGYKASGSRYEKGGKVSRKKSV
jgi:hypothetical protein